MTDSRLTLALDKGLLDLQQGAVVALINAPGDVNISGLEAREITASQSYFPDYARLVQRGLNVTPEPDGSANAAVIHCHRSKRATMDLIARALHLTQPGGLIALDGAKTDGIESIAKELKRVFAPVESYSKAHGKLIWFNRPDDLPDLTTWTASLNRLDGGFVAHPASFSADGIDKGSALLAGVLPALKGKVADLGAGWGFLSSCILKSEAVTSLDLIEADYHAVEAAKKNIQDARANFHWADALAYEADSYDVVVSNPPFHTTRKADPALGQGFITKAARILTPQGQLWMVANRNLPYEHALSEQFHMFETVAQTGGFKVIHARKPKTARPRR